jgi:hypothetical protein
MLLFIAELNHCLVRKFFIVDIARDLNIVFPTPSATAVTIRNMHQAADNGSLIPRQKMRMLMIAFSFAAAHRVLSQYAVGLLWVRPPYRSLSHVEQQAHSHSKDWHPFTWYLLLSPASTTAVSLESWGWFVEWTPAFIGTGMLVGLNTALSFFTGSLLAWSVSSRPPPMAHRSNHSQGDHWSCSGLAWSRVRHRKSRHGFCILLRNVWGFCQCVESESKILASLAGSCMYGCGFFDRSVTDICLLLAGLTYPDQNSLASGEYSGFQPRTRREVFCG